VAGVCMAVGSTRCKSIDSDSARNRSGRNVAANRAPRLTR
jgi:hypothetical protein